MTNAGILEKQETKVNSDALSFSVKQQKGFGAGAVMRKELMDILTIVHCKTYIELK